MREFDIIHIDIRKNGNKDKNKELHNLCAKKLSINNFRLTPWIATPCFRKARNGKWLSSRANDSDVVIQQAFGLLTALLSWIAAQMLTHLFAMTQENVIANERSKCGDPDFKCVSTCLIAYAIYQYSKNAVLYFSETTIRIRTLFLLRATGMPRRIFDCHFFP